MKLSESLDRTFVIGACLGAIRHSLDRPYGVRRQSEATTALFLPILKASSLSHESDVALAVRSNHAAERPPTFTTRLPLVPLTTYHLSLITIHVEGLASAAHG